MSNDRDTHFHGFAMLFYPELARLFYAMYAYRVLGEYEKAASVEQKIKDYLAQRAYDLACHFVTEINYGLDTHTVEDAVESIPDLTKWPTTAD